MDLKHVLTIAGSDSCGGAGIQADIKTFSANGTYGMSVITAVTAQNTMGVLESMDVSPKIIGAQIDAIFNDIKVHGTKIGMVSSIDTIRVIREKMKMYTPSNLVIDPVMISKNGFSLLKAEAKNMLVKELLPLAFLITPNIPEAEDIVEELTGKKITINSVEKMMEASRILIKTGCKNVLLKGGHLSENDSAPDILFNGTSFKVYNSKRINTKNTHGTGCTYSSAITANLALGYDIDEAIEKGKIYITEAIEHSLDIGHGVGPTNHFYKINNNLR